MNINQPMNWKFISISATIFCIIFGQFFVNCQEIEQIEKPKSEYEYLDNLALSAGTDKSSAYHDYTKVYADYFASIRNNSFRFLEIGICRGDSVKLWEKYFPAAELHFIDINPKLIKYFSERAHYHYVDQSDKIALVNLMISLGGGFDIIIDDGGHTMKQQINSFEALFPYLNSGGLYIIEDLHTSYWKAYGGGGTCKNPKSGPGTCINFLKNLVDDLNFTSARTQMADQNKTPSDIMKQLNYYQEHIYSISFYKSLCIVKKN